MLKKYKNELELLVICASIGGIFGYRGVIVMLLIFLGYWYVEWATKPDPEDQPTDSDKNT